MFTYIFTSQNDIQIIVADRYQEALIKLYIKANGDYRLIGTERNEQ